MSLPAAGPLPAAPDLQEIRPGVVYLALGPDGLDLVVEVDQGGTLTSCGRRTLATARPSDDTAVEVKNSFFRPTYDFRRARVAAGVHS